MNTLTRILVALASLLISVLFVKFLPVWVIVALFLVVIVAAVVYAIRNRGAVAAAAMPFLWYIVTPIAVVLVAYSLYALALPEHRTAISRLAHNLYMDRIFGLQKKSLGTENEQGTFGIMKGDVTPCDTSGKPIVIKDGDNKNTLIARKGRQVFAYNLDPHYPGNGKTEGMAEVMLMDGNGNFVDGPKVYVPLRMVDWDGKGENTDFSVSPDYKSPAPAPQPAAATFTSPAPEPAKSFPITGVWKLTAGNTITMSVKQGEFTDRINMDPGGVMTVQVKETRPNVYTGSYQWRNFSGEFEIIFTSSSTGHGTWNGKELIAERIS